MRVGIRNHINSWTVDTWTQRSHTTSQIQMDSTPKKVVQTIQRTGTPQVFLKQPGQCLDLSVGRANLSSPSNKSTSKTKTLASGKKFLPGADAFLTTNLNTNLGLANGTPIKLHSRLTFATREQLMAVRSQIRSLPPGSVVTLDEPPLSVNIEILSTFDSKTTPSAKKMAQIDILKKHSIVKGETIIPIPIMRTHCKTHAFSVHSTSGISKAHTRELFPFEMSFAMTVHKAQGRTIPRVVLALSHRDNAHSQMSCASTHVALSRVKHRDNLRILMHNSGPRPGILALKCITHLKHCIHVLDYYSGFPEKTQSGKWNSAKSLRAKQSRSALRH